MRQPIGNFRAAGRSAEVERAERVREKSLCICPRASVKRPGAAIFDADLRCRLGGLCIGIPIKYQCELLSRDGVVRTEAAVREALKNAFHHAPRNAAVVPAAAHGVCKIAGRSCCGAVFHAPKNCGKHCSGKGGVRAKLPGTGPVHPAALGDRPNGFFVPRVFGHVRIACLRRADRRCQQDCRQQHG